MPIPRIVVATGVVVMIVIAGCGPGSSGLRRSLSWWGGESIENCLSRVGTTLSVGAAAWCPERRGWTYGLLFEPAREAGSGPGLLMVSYVYPGLPAHRAGIKAGDVVHEMNGEAVGDRRGDALLAEGERLAKARIQPVTFSVESDGNRRKIDLFAVAICPIKVETVQHSGLAAVADGTHIRITTGMLDFLRTEEELAWILAHELAHNVLEHSQQTRLETALESMLTQAAVQARSVETATRMERETQADSVAAYMLAQAGFNLKRARGALERFVALYQQQPEAFRSATHPSPPDRLASFDNVVKDIYAIQARGEPLVPAKQGVIRP